MVVTRSGILVFLCVALFYGGWVKFAAEGYAIYLIDYALRLSLCVLAVALGGLTIAKFKVDSWGRMVLLSVVVLAVILLSYKLYRAFYAPFPLFGLPIAKFPDIEDPWLSALDLSLGMALVALSEEFVFRYLFARAIPNSRTALYVLSGLAFGFLHAPQGLGLVVEATFAGIVLMFLYRRTGTLTAPVAVHFLTDLILFSGIGCPYGIGDC